jgi:Amt family ammonium transporter
LVGGIIGSILLGVFAQSSVNEAVPDGLLYGGTVFFFKQVAAVAAVILFTFTATYILARIVKAITGLRVHEDQEHHGLDISLHEERGYVLTE